LEFKKVLVLAIEHLVTVVVVVVVVVDWLVCWGKKPY
jgi:hypothetical protein